MNNTLEWNDLQDNTAQDRNHTADFGVVDNDNILMGKEDAGVSPIEIYLSEMYPLGQYHIADKYCEHTGSWDYSIYLNKQSMKPSSPLNALYLSWNPQELKEFYDYCRVQRRDSIEIKQAYANAGHFAAPKFFRHPVIDADLLLKFGVAYNANYLDYLWCLGQSYPWTFFTDRMIPTVCPDNFKGINIEKVSSI